MKKKRNDNVAATSLHATRHTPHASHLLIIPSVLQSPQSGSHSAGVSRPISARNRTIQPGPAENNADPRGAMSRMRRVCWLGTICCVVYSFVDSSPESSSLYKHRTSKVSQHSPMNAQKRGHPTNNGNNEEGTGEDGDGEAEQGEFNANTIRARDVRVLLHQRALPSVLEIDVVRIEISLR